MLANIPSRVARPAGPLWNVTKTLLQSLAMWTTFFAAGPWALVLVEDRLGWPRLATSPLGRAIAVALFVALGLPALATGVLMALRGQGTPFPLDAPRALVIIGPYRFVRNPMALLSIAQGFAVALYLGSPLVLAYDLAGLVIWNWVARPWEERDLVARFGEPYLLYRRRVRCWRPRLRPYDPAHEEREPPLASERTTPPARPVVLFDGHCRFCTAQAKNLMRLTPRGAVELVSFQEPGVLDRFPGITHAACMEAMHLVLPDGRVFAGFEAAVRAVALSVPGRIAYLYYLPGIRGACDLVYAIIARNRYRLMGKAVTDGECADGTCHLHVK